MLEVAFAAMALGGPAPAGATGPPPPCCGSPTPTSYVPTLDGPKRLRVGSVADFYSTSTQSLTLCYQVGTSRIGCATSGVDWFHLLVRSGSTQYVTLRVDGKVVARLVYRNVR